MRRVRVVHRYWKKRWNIGWQNMTVMWNKNSTNWTFWRFVLLDFLFGLFPLNPVFHMSEKSKAIGNFAVFRPSQILPTCENKENVDIGWSGINREKRERFYFSDPCQSSAMIGNVVVVFSQVRVRALLPHWPHWPACTLSVPLSFNIC